eukprot:gene25897-biopygen1323
MAGSGNVNRVISSACAQSLFRSKAPVSIKDGYFACVSEDFRMTDEPGHTWSYPDLYLQRRPGVMKGRLSMSFRSACLSGLEKAGEECIEIWFGGGVSKPYLDALLMHCPTKNTLKCYGRIMPSSVSPKLRMAELYNILQNYYGIEERPPGSTKKPQGRQQKPFVASSFLKASLVVADFGIAPSLP